MGLPAPAEAFSFPSLRAAAPREPSPPRPASPLQEVPPPPSVQDLQEALAERQPRVEILSPAPESLLPTGPWTLRLRVRDWPLVEAGPLGPGPHLAVQIDDEPPRSTVKTELTLPPLSPGSHRLTVYAARPWGEAVKSPGAYLQIRVHRTAPNPVAVPVPGSPQLIATAPPTEAVAEPVLLDWLLLDAPLQNLRTGDGGWKLRVTVNGDSFLVDRQVPLWLKGWRRGVNALQLELVDGRGDPLNPPFNSLVREVTVQVGVPGTPDPGSRLTPTERARLLGEEPPVPPQPPESPEAPEAPAKPEPARPPEPSAGPPSSGGPNTRPSEESPAQAPTPAANPPEAGKGPQAAAPLPPESAALPEPMPAEEADAEQAPPEERSPQPMAGATAPASPPPPQEAQTPEPEAPRPPAPPTAPSGVPTPPAASAAPSPPGVAALDSSPLAGSPQPEPPPLENPDAAPEGKGNEPPPPEPPPAEKAPSFADVERSALPPVPPPEEGSGPPGPTLPSARQELNPDGTLIRPKTEGRLASLRAAVRERLGR